MRAVLLTLTVSLLLFSIPSSVRAAPEKRVVAILYFDNNTGRGDLDVLKKGFADMMVTDLASVPSLQVVERNRLEDVLSELKLQKSKFFDPKTAVKIGKGLGARYAVTGAFAAFDPKMRIDIRMIEIGTGKVVLADKVVGDKTKLFELQAELVKKFVEGLEVKAPRPSKARRVPNVDTLLEYSKGVDLADQGQLDEANAAFAKLVKKHPTFVLARAKRAELLKRLEESKTRREGVIAQSGATLAKTVSAYLETQKLDLEDEERAKTYLAYRVLNGVFLVRSLAPHIIGTGPAYVAKGHEAAAYRILRALHQNQERLIDEVDRFSVAFTQELPGGQRFLDGSLRLPKTAAEEARRVGIDSSLTVDRLKTRVQLAELLLLARLFDGNKHQFIGPTLASVDPKLEKRAYAALDEAYTIGHELLLGAPQYAYPLVGVLDTHASALLMRGKTEAGIGKYQKILDDFPTGSQYARYEKAIQVELGMQYSHSRSVRAGFIAAYETCEDMEFRKGLSTVMSERVRLDGRRALTDVVAEIEKHCRGHEKAKRFWSYLYMHVGLFAGTRGDCEMFEAMVKKYLAAGGSTQDLKGYRKNHAKTCRQDG